MRGYPTRRRHHLCGILFFLLLRTTAFPWLYQLEGTYIYRVVIVVTSGVVIVVLVHFGMHKTVPKAHFFSGIINFESHPNETNARPTTLAADDLENEQPTRIVTSRTV